MGTPRPRRSARSCDVVKWRTLAGGARATVGCGAVPAGEAVLQATSHSRQASMSAGASASGHAWRGWSAEESFEVAQPRQRALASCRCARSTICHSEICHSSLAEPSTGAAELDRGGVGGGGGGGCPRASPPPPPPTRHARCQRRSADASESLLRPARYAYSVHVAQPARVWCSSRH